MSTENARDGECVCGVSVAAHYDASNRRVSCAQAARVAASYRLDFATAPVTPTLPGFKMASAAALRLVHSSNWPTPEPPA